MRLLPAGAPVIVNDGAVCAVIEPVLPAVRAEKFSGLPFASVSDALRVITLLGSLLSVQVSKDGFEVDILVPFISKE